MPGFCRAAPPPGAQKTGSGTDDASDDDAAGDTTEGSADPLGTDAEVVSFQHEATLACGASATAQLVLRNTGSETWSAAAGDSLVSVGSDPFGGTAVPIPDLVEVSAGGTFLFEIGMVAPAEGGTYATSWQMARGGSPFGAIATGEIAVDCTAPTPELPDVYPIIEQVAAEHGDLLETNTYESCGQFVQHVLAALSAQDPEWGHVSKTAGESQYTPPGFGPIDVDGWTVTGFSHDAIFHRASYWQVDIIVNAAANSDPDPSIHGPASITWGVIPQDEYRKNNPWMPAVPL